MRIGEAHLPAGTRIGQPRIGRLQIGASHQAHAPGLRTGRQHRRDGPIVRNRTGRAYVHRRGAIGQADIAASRQEGPGAQGQSTGQTHAVDFVVGQRGAAGQRHAARPGHPRHGRRQRQTAAGAEAGAGGQVQSLAKQAAGRPEQVAGGIQQRSLEHRSRRQLQWLAEHRLDRQPGTGGQGHGLDRQFEVERLAGREEAVVVQPHASRRHHPIAAQVILAG